MTSQERARYILYDAATSYCLMRNSYVEEIAKYIKSEEVKSSPTKFDFSGFDRFDYMVTILPYLAGAEFKAMSFRSVNDETRFTITMPIDQAFEWIQEQYDQTQRIWAQLHSNRTDWATDQL